MGNGTTPGHTTGSPTTGLYISLQPQIKAWTTHALNQPSPPNPFGGIHSARRSRLDAKRLPKGPATSQPDAVPDVDAILDEIIGQDLGFPASPLCSSERDAASLWLSTIAEVADEYPFHYSNKSRGLHVKVAQTPSPFERLKPQAPNRVARRVRGGANPTGMGEEPMECYPGTHSRAHLAKILFAGVYETETSEDLMESIEEEHLLPTHHRPRQDHFQIFAPEMSEEPMLSIEEEQTHIPFTMHVGPRWVAHWV